MRESLPRRRAAREADARASCNLTGCFDNVSIDECYEAPTDTSPADAPVHTELPDRIEFHKSHFTAPTGTASAKPPVDTEAPGWTEFHQSRFVAPTVAPTKTNAATNTPTKLPLAKPTHYAL